MDGDSEAILPIVRYEVSPCYLLGDYNINILFRELYSPLYTYAYILINPRYLLGDNNINFLNYASHAQTAQFLDMMSSNGFFATYHSSIKSGCHISHINWQYIHHWYQWYAGINSSLIYLTTFQCFILPSKWKSRKMMHMYIKDCIVPGAKKIFVMPWAT